MRTMHTSRRAPTRRAERGNGSALGVQHRSSCGLLCDPSSEHAMDVPAQIARYALDPIAATEEPEALAARRLDLEIIAHRPHLARAQPPFAMDALGTVARGDLIGFPAPADRKSTRLNSVTNAHLVCRLLLEKKQRNNPQPIKQCS